MRPIPPTEHLAHLATRRSASFLQTPAWAQVKSEWSHESLGWFRDGEAAPVGSALVLYRQLPKVKRYLAYLPEGPVIDWDDDDLGAWLDPMVDHLRGAKAFGVRIGPPVVTRRWDAAAVKAGLADDHVGRLDDVAPTVREAGGARVVSRLGDLGWRRQGEGAGFSTGQPRHVFQVPLRDADGAARTEEDVLKGMNQQWRRNIKKAAKQGVEIERGGPGDLKAFHELYVLTAERDGFTPRPLSYFETMYDALEAQQQDRIRVYLARHEGDLVASTIWIRVGTHTWYAYGASSTEKREVRGSNAIQWQMICDSMAAGAHVYDLRGITPTLDSEDDHVGLIQFKVGTGGEAVEHAGEWDLPLNRALYAAFDLYMKRR